MYHYAGNNPVRYVDPDGLSTQIDEDTGIIISGNNDNDCGVYAVPTVNGERVAGPLNKVVYTTRPDYAVNPPTPASVQNEDLTKEKTSGYLFLLYRNNSGIDKTLRQLGLLEKVKYAVNNNKKLSLDHSGTVLSKFIRQILKGDGTTFENSYDFTSVKFAIGKAIVRGSLDGIIFKNKNGSMHIEGVINYGFEDIFTDPYDLINLIPGEWNPDGKPYKITDTWRQNINGDF